MASDGSLDKGVPLARHKDVLYSQRETPSVGNSQSPDSPHHGDLTRKRSVGHKLFFSVYVGVMKKLVLTLYQKTAFSLFLGIILLALMTLVLFGAIHLRDCPAEPYLPLYLITAGAVGSMQTLFDMVERCLSWSDKKDKAVKRGKYGVDDEMEEEGGNVVMIGLQIILSCFMLCWFVAGHVWTYRLHDVVDWNNSTLPTYCSEMVYKCSFWLMPAVYFTIIFLCCTVCCWGTVLVLIKKNMILHGIPEEAEVPQKYRHNGHKTETFSKLKQKILNAVNASKNEDDVELIPSDIIFAVRIGSQTTETVRPVIAKFRYWKDYMWLLSLREALHHSGSVVLADYMTKKERHKLLSSWYFEKGRVLDIRNSREMAQHNDEQTTVVTDDHQRRNSRPSQKLDVYSVLSVGLLDSLYVRKASLEKEPEASQIITLV